MLSETKEKSEIIQKANQTKVLIIDHDKAVRRVLQLALTANGYLVDEVATGQEGILSFASLQPQLILLDLELPDMTGIEIIRMLREWTKAPILILSFRDHDVDKVEALDCGADDYLVKPFSIPELMARMRVALRYVQTETAKSVFSSGDLRVNLAAHIVEVKGQQIALTPTEYELLRVMVNHAGKLITQQQFWKLIRNEDYRLGSHLIRVHMSNLRHKIEADPSNPQYILTEPGLGYRLRADR